jgi:polyhydroxyalkanoate synthesis regulator phasin
MLPGVPWALDDPFEDSLVPKCDGSIIMDGCVYRDSYRGRQRTETYFVEDSAMFETLDKMMMASLGALSMTRERAEKMFDEYVSRGKAEKENRTGFVKEVMDSAEKTRSELEKVIAEQVQQTVTSLHLASKEDVERIEQKLDELLKQK